MAGIKHALQYFGATPFEQIQGKTIWDRHAAIQARQMTTYCKLCGQELVHSDIDENGHRVNPEWEHQYQMHYRCYTQRMMERRR